MLSPSSSSSSSSSSSQLLPLSLSEKVAYVLENVLINKGTYGYVHKGLNQSTNEEVALKRLILHNESVNGFPVTSLREISILRSIENPYCVKLYDVIATSKGHIYLVFEYCEHDLDVLLKEFKKPFAESEIKTIMLQLFNAVSYLHENQIIHRDIKLSNLLYNNKGELKVADFGLSRLLPVTTSIEMMTLKVVSLYYRAPELLLGARTYSTSIDEWACGCVMAELLRGEALFTGDNEIEVILRIFDILGAPNTTICPELMELELVQTKAIDIHRESILKAYNNLQHYFSVDFSRDGFELLNLLLCYDPTKRIASRNAANHNYFYTSPLPQDEPLMPTFPRRHSASEWVKGKEQIVGGNDIFTKV